MEGWFSEVGCFNYCLKTMFSFLDYSSYLHNQLGIVFVLGNHVMPVTEPGLPLAKLHSVLWALSLYLHSFQIESFSSLSIVNISCHSFLASSSSVVASVFDFCYINYNMSWSTLRCARVYFVWKSMSSCIWLFKSFLNLRKLSHIISLSKNSAFFSPPSGIERI